MDNRDYLDLVFRSIHCFSNDGRLLPAELDELMQIALRDETVDANEKRVLGSIFAKLVPAELTPEMLEKIAQIRARHAF